MPEGSKRSSLCPLIATLVHRQRGLESGLRELRREISDSDDDGDEEDFGGVASPTTPCVAS